MFGSAFCATATIWMIGAAPASGAANVLANWSMVPGGGQVVADASGKGNDGVLGSDPSAEAADPVWVAGPAGAGALRFSGAQYVSVPDTTELEPAHVAIDGWVRADASPGLWRYVLSKGSDGCVRAAYGLYSGFAGGLSFYVSSANRFTISPEAPAALVWDGAWHHVRGTFDGSVVELYVDGARVGDGTPTAEPIFYGVASRGIYLGTYHGTCEQPFVGDIGPISVWDGPDLPRPDLGGVVTAAPGTPTSLPVRNAGGAGGGGPGPVATPPPPSLTNRCLIVAVGRGTIRRNRRTRLGVTVHRGRRAVARARVLARGAGVFVSARTDGQGHAQLVVRARKQGRVNVSVSGQPKVCGAATVHVAG